MTLGGLQGSNNLSLENCNNSPVSLTVGGNNADTTFSGSLSGLAGSTLIKTVNFGTVTSEDGTLTLTGTNNAFSGQVIVNGGTLSISSDSNLGDSSATNVTIINSGATLQAVGYVVLDASHVLEIGPGAVIDVPAAAP